MPQQPLTPRTIVTILVGLVVLSGLSIWRLGFTGAPLADARLTTIHGETMGTTYTVKLVDATARRAELEEGIRAILDEVNGKMSTYDPDSELSRFNANATTSAQALSSETLEVMALALEISRQTQGAYDITVGPLVNAWGFGPDGPATRPTDVEIESLRDRCGYEKLLVDTDAGTATKAIPELYCDLSSIAKGYAVDRVADWLASLGASDYMVEIGGEVRTGGHNVEGLPWQMGIRRPVAGQQAVHRVIGISDKAMATSGDYQNFYIVDGERITHIIDPRTGKPTRSTLASVTVLHENCATADAYATALTVLGPDEGLDFADRHGLAVLFILRTEDDAFTERGSDAFNEFTASESVILKP